MAKSSLNFSSTVTRFLDELDHPRRSEIERLRFLILSAECGLTESIKWNGPNYSIGGDDRITIRINPLKQLQLVFHRGAKVKSQPDEKLIKNDYNLLEWKANDRAVASIINKEELDLNAEKLMMLIKVWIIAST